VFADAISVLLMAVSRPVRELLSRPIVTSADLWRWLPRVVKGALSRALYAKRGCYVIIGRHKSGKWKRYGGVSKSVYHRGLVHRRIIDCLKRGKRVSKSQILHCHRELAEPGWEFAIFCVATFDPKDFWLYSYVLESLFMCLLGTVIKVATNDHKPAMVALVESLDLNLVSGPAATPLNKALSIAQNQASERDRPAICCRVCGRSDESDVVVWRTHPAAESFQNDSWACKRCFEHYRKWGTDKTMAEIQRAFSLHEAKKTAPCDRVCNECHKSNKELSSSRDWRLDKENFGTWLCRSCYGQRGCGSTCKECASTTSSYWWDNGTLCNVCYLAAKNAAHQNAGYTCRECATTTSTTWHDLNNPAGQLCSACHYEATTARNQNAGYTCRDCATTTSTTWHDKTNPAGQLCDKCYNDAKAKPTGNEVCRSCKATWSSGGQWVDKKNKAGPLCCKCSNEAKLTGDEICRECKSTTTSDRWKDRKNKAGLLCAKCYAKAGKIRRAAEKAKAEKSKA
jgi:hypothetical protein